LGIAASKYIVYLDAMPCNQPHVKVKTMAIGELAADALDRPSLIRRGVACQPDWLH
jgi:hypothetical protein